MNRIITTILGAASLLHVCTVFAEQGAPPLPHWTFSEDMIFPADRPLKRPEDGIALADGRVIVSDQDHGLRLIHPDGATRPFGKLRAAGYQHNPPEIVGGCNGVTLEPAGTHLLFADVFRGGIYRVEIATEASERIYQHPFGVNMARGDSHGGIWFTQSTRNGPEFGERDLFKSVDTPTPDGAVFYLPPASGSEPRVAVTLDDGLLFANGIALDETRGFLYVAETLGNRVLRYRVDTAAGTVGERTVALEVAEPDNLELDAHNRLWIARPIRSEILVLDLTSGATHSAFRITSPEQEAMIAEIEARLKAGTSWLELMNPNLWSPSPVAMTGMILSPNDGTVYVTGLGNALIRLER